MPILFLIWASLSYADPLLDAILGYKYVPVEQVVYEESYEEPYYPDEFGNNETGEGPFHYSWDNIYLCEYCDTEIIIDPYSQNDLDY